MRLQLTTLALLAGLSLSGAAQATLFDRGGGLIYDSVLKVTWLQNANLAATDTFGVSGINANGSMTWNTANQWIAAMNAADYLGYNDWRLPTMIDTGSPGCDYGNIGTDCGYNVQTVSGGTVYSELATLYYTELGNKGSYDTSGNPQSGAGVTNSGPFTNMQSDVYWSGLEYWPYISAWGFSTANGGQGEDQEWYDFYAWAVRPGDVAAVPEADTWAMLLAGLGLVGVAARRRRG